MKPNRFFLLVILLVAVLSAGFTAQAQDRVVAWGQNHEGQIDIPDGLEDVVQVDGGANFAIALRANGSIAAWGSNQYGQTDVPAGLTNAVQIAAGDRHSLALRADGTVVGWGIGSAASPPTGLSDVAQVAAGYDYSLALRTDGTVVGWGSNPSAQEVPADLTDAVQVATAGSNSLALRADGTVVGWGSGPAASPVVAGLNNIAQVDLGVNFGIALRANGTVVAWGSNNMGQTDVPAGLTGVVQIAAFNTHSLALRANGSVVAWGGNEHGQTDVPTRLPTAYQVSGGNMFSMVLLRLQENSQRLNMHVSAQELDIHPTGTATFSFVFRNGDNNVVNNVPVQIQVFSDGELIHHETTAGIPYGGTWGFDVPADISEDLHFRFQAVHPNYPHSQARMVTVPLMLPRIVGWGPNFNGQLTMPAGMGTVVQISSGGSHSIALRADGTAVSWGANTGGSTEMPDGLNDIVHVAASPLNSSFAVRTNGSVVAWGANNGGETDVPAGLSDVVQVEAGGRFAMALKTDGTVVAWGTNNNGETGVPAGLSEVVQVAAADNASLALRADGTVVAWGSNVSGLTEVPEGLTGVVQIASGGVHFLALKADGTVVAWGNNSAGQTDVPVGLTNVVNVAAGNGHSMALIADGSIVAWGLNTNGQIDLPADLPDAYQIDGGSQFSLALVRLPEENSRFLHMQAGAVHPQIFPWEPATYSFNFLNGDGVLVTDVPVRIRLFNDGELIHEETTVIATSLGTWDFDVPQGVSGDLHAHLQAVHPDYPHSPARIATVHVVSVPPRIVGWGQNSDGQIDFPPIDLEDVVQVDGGSEFAIALRADGTVVGWGRNHVGQTNVPEGLTNAVQIAAGENHSLALRADGTVIGWGNGQAASVPTGLSDIVQVAAGFNYSLVLRADGTVVGWGSNQSAPDVPADLTDVVQIVTVGSHSLALRANGTVVGWGSGQAANVPAGLNNVVQVETGLHFGIALKADGTVVSWGGNVPAGLDDVVQIAALNAHSLALRADGSVVAWGGSNAHGQIDVPEDLPEAYQVSGGNMFSMVLVRLPDEDSQFLHARVEAQETEIPTDGTGTFSFTFHDGDGTAINDVPVEVRLFNDGELIHQETTAGIANGGTWDFDVPAGISGDLHAYFKTAHTDYPHSPASMLTVEVQDVNSPPVFTSTPVTEAVENEVYLYEISATDPDGDALTITASVLPDWLTLTDHGNGTATLTGTPTSTREMVTTSGLAADRDGVASTLTSEGPHTANVGPNPVTLVVSDGELEAEQVFTIQVEAANQPPTFTSTPITEAVENEVYTYQITTSDPDGDNVTISLSVLPSWLTLTDNGNGTATLTGTPLAAHVGANAVTLVVSDGDMNAQQAFTIQVEAANQPPVFTSTPVTEAFENEVYLYEITASDPDGDNLTISSSVLPSWLTLTDHGDGTATLTGTPTVTRGGMPETGRTASSIGLDGELSRGIDLAANVGPNPVTLVVSDGDLETEQEFVIQVIAEEVNNPPVFTSTPVTEALENEVYLYEITASDPDGDNLTISSSVLPSWLTLTDNGNGTATLTGTPLAAHVGANAVTLVVSDGDMNAQQAFTIQVEAANQPPVFTSTPITEALENEVYLYQITTSDPDGDDVTISSSVLPSWLTLTDNGNGTATLTGTPLAAHVGANDVTLVVSDGDLNAQQAFTIQVEAANQPPVFTSTPVTEGAVGEAYLYAIAASDPEGSDVTITAPVLPEWLTLTDNGNGTATLSGTPLEGHVGPNPVTLIASDGDLTTEQSFNVQVISVEMNNPPMFTSEPVTEAHEDQVYLYEITATDPDGDDLVISASVLPEWLALTDHGDGTATLTGTPGADDVGANAVTLVASDGELDVEQEFNVQVSAIEVNNPPVFTSEPVTEAHEDQVYLYEITATDPDGDDLVISASVLPEWLALTDHGDGTATLMGTAGADDVGANAVTLVASDGELDVEQEFNVQVSAIEVNNPPVFTSEPVTEAHEDQVYLYEITATDPDGDDLVISASVLPEWLALTDHGDGTATLTGTPGADDVGANAVTLVASDGELDVEQEFSVQVIADDTNNPPTPAVITSPEDGTEIIVTETPGDIVAITWTLSEDPDGDEVTYVWEADFNEDFSEPAFALVTSETSLEVAMSDLMTAMIDFGITPGQSAPLHHRVLSSDGEHTTTGPAVTMLLMYAVSNEDERESDVFMVHGLYPNPASGPMTVAYDLPESADVRVDIYDVLGRVVSQIDAGLVAAGVERTITIPDGSLGAGTYLYRLVANGTGKAEVFTGRFTIVR